MTVIVQVNSTSGSASLGRLDVARPYLFDRYYLLSDLEPELTTYSSTHVYAINASANRRIEFSGSGLTYTIDPLTGLAITGGTITAIRVWTNDATPVLIETQNYSANPIGAVEIYSAIGEYSETNNQAGLDAIFMTRPYDYTGSIDADIFAGGNQNDLLAGGSGSDVLIGYGASDTVTGLGGADRLYGGGGDDYLDGGSEYDYMAGEDGSDTYVVSAGDEFASELAGQGTDTVVSGFTYVLNSNIENLRLSGSLTIDGYGNELDNRIEGNSAANSLNGNNGADTLLGRGGNDTLNGGDGIDIAAYGMSLAAVRVDLAVQGVAQNTWAEGNDTLNSIEGLLGSDFNDVLYGNNAANSINGGAGADTIYGRDGSDGISGSDGNDLIDGGASNDWMTGGTGNDTYYVDNTLDVVTEFAGAGTQDTIIATVNVRLDTTTTAMGVEHVVLQGTAGLTAVGSATYNIITGNTGNNYIAGYNGNDTISGGSGNDTVFGGDGKDLLTGGIGDDKFLFSFIADSGGTQPRRDVITDFAQIAGNNDWIDLALTDANGAAAGNQAFIWLGTGAFTGASGELRYFQDVANNQTIIQGNVRVDAASPGPELSIELTGLYTLTAGGTSAFDIIL